MKKRKFLAASLIAAATVFIALACNKQSQADPKEPAAREKIETLAQRFTQPIGSDYADVKQQYSSLNETDLKTFWQSVYRITHQNSMDVSKEAEFQSMIEEMNNKSKNQFGVTFNKVPKKDLSKIFSEDKIRSANTPGQEKIIPPPDPTPCEFLPYPEFFYKAYGNPYSGPANSWRIVDYYQGDCDGIEMTYNGFYNRIRPITPLGDQAIVLFLQGDHIFANGTKTRVLHKKSSAENWFGIPAYIGINNNIRMTLAPLQPD